MTYPTKKLGEVLELCDSGTWGDESSDGLPLLRSTNMQNGQLILDDLKIIDVPKDKIERYLLREGDILITKSSGSVDHIGKSLYITKEMDGKYGFSNFTQRLRVDKKQVLPRWIYLKISNPATREFLLNASQTTTGLRNLKIPALKELEIPLPSLEVQKKVVAKLESLLAKVNEAKKLRAEARESADNLLSAELHKIFEEGKNKGWEEKKLGEVCDLNPKKSEVKGEPDDLLVSFVPMSTVDEYLQAIVYFEERKLGEVCKGYTYFRDGDVLFAKITPCMENGKVAVAKGLKSGIGFGTTEFHVLRPKKEVLAEWIYSIVRQQWFRDLAEEKMTGSAGQKRVPTSFLENYQIPVPPLSEQKKLIKRLEKVSQKVDKVKEIQNVTENDFVVLEQAVLSKAFNGELVEEKSVAAQPIPSPIKIFPIQQAIGVTFQRGFERGEMPLAKVLYISQELFDVPLAIPFTPQNLGPYDISVKKALTGGLRRNNRFFKKRGQVYTLGDGSNKLLRYTNAKAVRQMNQALDSLLPLIKDADSPSIERLATVCKIVQDTKSTSENIVITEMRKWKGNKFTDGQIKKSLQFIVSKGWENKLIDG